MTALLTGARVSSWTVYRASCPCGWVGRLRMGLNAECDAKQDASRHCCAAPDQEGDASR